MKWNDGISKQFEDFFNENLKNIGPDAVQAYVEVIDEETLQTVERLKKSTPKRTGGLSNSIKSIKVIGSKQYYGHKIVFDGYDEQGVAYQKIANTLNIGNFNKNIAPTRFIDRTIRKLKNMDDRIINRFEEKLKLRR